MLKIDDEYFVEADKYGYTLKRTAMPEYDGRSMKLLEARGVKPSEKPVTSLIGYYNDLGDALAGYLKEIVRATIQKQDMVISDLVQMITDLKESLRGVVE